MLGELAKWLDSQPPVEEPLAGSLLALVHELGTLLVELVTWLEPELVLEPALELVLVLEPALEFELELELVLEVGPEPAEVADHMQQHKL